MPHEEQPTHEIAQTHRSLLQRIVSVTSKRRRLSEAEEASFSRYVVSELSRPDRDALGPFRGLSGIKSYLAVVVQRLSNAFGRRDPSPSPEPSPIEDAIRRTSSSLSPREALVLRMWFETGMTTQKIAAVMDLDPGDVLAIIAARTDIVQKSMAQTRAAD